jgi:hypothetical protein
VHDVTNVFISYANEDAASAEMLADALQRAGFSIWWDRYIPPGKTWDEVIGRALDTAGCVIVLWSGTSVQSRWVREEAERAASRSCLIPALIEKVEPPLGFGRIQAADLSQWRGDERDPRFANLVRAISDLVRTTPNGSALDQRVGEWVKPRVFTSQRLSKQRALSQGAGQNSAFVSSSSGCKRPIAVALRTGRKNSNEESSLCKSS